ncbi:MULTISPECIES: FMN-binding glutamate synthase family protein [unclassified Idiomarina]|uniref:FMN-binding glutamate synthase family protein n=1 Tax=unclassified Idiomarina TaxID=2614829 RepID=UPI000C95D6B3|nr:MULTISPECIES: FMN-binding glutamate synthase family protein [unclassified Idiomarina]MAD53705.1 FMN-binding glutamate synthase family protein [Idiomarinaceae bacterium]MEC7643591.1 FMN-binding glutamate synthase family protein [Pseudomonadota bacterium]NQZ02964.1 FMN-binding glutamate synthase family protein [Idiomarina sp.]|tara:strand:+ start:1224 stop:2738 length:1515 start_codon:yes stop_codon:yes gene_type:complete
MESQSWFDNSALLTVAQWLAALFVLGIIALVVSVGVMYVVDKIQTRHTIRRNYPVVGRFRYIFERMGEFMRQYFFAMDREEMPFNRAQRSWVYRAAKNADRNVAFGSTRDLTRTGTIIFSNAPYPPLAEQSVSPQPVKIGPYCSKPYSPTSYFHISGMSYGALSPVAVKALSAGAKKAGCWLNTGEGGLSPYHLSGHCDVVFQMGTAKFGVRTQDGKLDESRLAELGRHDSVKMFEIKLSQGAKPGKGGILPGIKVNQEIAEIRGIKVGEDAISPNRHPEISNNEELLDFIDKVRTITGKPTGFKFVMGDPSWIDELVDSILSRGEEAAPDFITLDSADGGTGAAPQPLIDYVGLKLSESLPILVDKLTEAGLHERIRIICSGKMISPADVAWAIAMGADFVVSARGFMFSLGCIQAMQCNKNTCPTGVTTDDPKLQRGLDPQDKSERVANYHKYLEYGVNIIAHSCGVTDPRQLNRRHARVIKPDGESISLAERYPLPPARRR